MEMHFILNPIANNGKSANNFLEIEKFLKESNVKCFVYHTKYMHHATQIAREISSQNKQVHIISAGGDGTLSDVLNGIVDFKNTYLSVLPLGSGNDFAMNFKEISHTNQIKNLKRLIEQKSTHIDFLVVNDKYRCMNALGAGMVPNVIKKYMTYKHFSQKTKYRLAVISKSLFFTVHNISYSIDEGKTWNNVKTITFSVGNGETVGGGIKLIPNASVNDGYITVSMVKKINRLLTLHNLNKIMKGKTATLKAHQTFNCKHLLVKIDRKLFDIDGELFENTDQLSIKIIHNELNFII